MPSFDIVRRAEPARSFRVQSTIDRFTMPEGKVTERFTGSLPIEGMDWNVGLIVGASGSGKSTIARECFGEFASFAFKAPAVIDDMPTATFDAIAQTFTSVGFASPPSWLKPYGVLSNGEKMRVDLARAIMSDADPIVFDEFTSVVDRTVAQTASAAVAKAVRKANKRFVAVSCHRDVADWLQPDWIYDTDAKAFFFAKSDDGRRLTSKSMKSAARFGLKSGSASRAFTT